MRVFQGPAVRVEDFLELPREWIFGRERVVNTEDGDVQILRPGTQVDLTGKMVNR